MMTQKSPTRRVVTSHNTHVTLLTNLASSEPVTFPVTPPALVPPRNSSALEAPLSQLHTNSQASWNSVPCSNSGITNTALNISVSSLVPVPVPVHNLVPVPIPCSDIAFLCSDPYSDMLLFLMAMLSDSYI